MSQATVKSAQAVTSQVNVEVQSTAKSQAILTFQLVSKVVVLTSVPEMFVAFTSVALTVSILPVVAVIVVQVNSHSAVIFPVKVTSQLTVDSVTLERFSCIFSIAFCNAPVSKETL